MKYVYRIDDLSPFMDMEVLDAYLELFSTHGVVPLLGVIPDNRDEHLMTHQENPRFWEKMRVLSGEGCIEIAQHGYHHLYSTDDGGVLGSRYGFGNRSEFAGLPYEEQVHKIGSGLAILREQGLDTKVFMAPSHTFDFMTLQALRNLGFESITDGIALYPFDMGGVRWVPCQFGRPLYFPIGILTICLHIKTFNSSYYKALDKHLSCGYPWLRYSEASQLPVTASTRIMNEFFAIAYYGGLKLKRVIRRMKE